jgi:hypothetical protein
MTVIGGAMETQQIGNRHNVLKLPKGKRMRTEIHDSWSLSQRFKKSIAKRCSPLLEAVISGKMVVAICH